MPTNQNENVISSEVKKASKPKNIKKLILNTLYTILMVLLSILVITLVLGRLANRITFIFDKAVIWIISNSMEDQIPAQSYILVEKVSAKDVKVGDVIVFYSDDPALNGSFNTHRVIEIIGDNEEFVTMGDNNLVADTYTAKADKVQGLYRTNLPFLTAVMRFVMSPIGFAVIVGILALAVVLPIFVPKNKKDIKL